MDRKRAKQIASSPVMANVCYNGVNVYIESVSETSDTASVHRLNQPRSTQVVPLGSLIEQ